MFHKKGFCFLHSESKINGKKIKNKKSLVLGVFFSFFLIAFVVPLISAGVAQIFGIKDIRLNLNFYHINSNFTMEGKHSFINYLLVYLSPVFIYAAIQITLMVLLRKTPAGTMRFIFIFIILFTSGYLIIDIFYGAFMVILNINSANNWKLFLDHTQFGEMQKIGFMFFSLIVLTGYLNLVAKKIVSYING